MGNGDVRPRGGGHLGLPRRRRRRRGPGWQHRHDHQPDGLPAAVDAELTVYPSVDHDSWTRTYDQSAGHDIYDWLLGYTVAGPAVAESTRRTKSERRIAETSVAS